MIVELVDTKLTEKWGEILKILKYFRSSTVKGQTQHTETVSVLDFCCIS